MDTVLKQKLSQAIDLLNEIDDLLDNEIVLASPHDTGDEFTFWGLSLMIEEYLKKTS